MISIGLHLLVFLFICLACCAGFGFLVIGLGKFYAKPPVKTPPSTSTPLMETSKIDYRV